MTQIERQQEKELAYRASGGVAERVLRVELELHLGREPITGCLRPERGAEEPVVGWLGFVDALKRLNERKEQP